jgi:hypothetical protein
MNTTTIDQAVKKSRTLSEMRAYYLSKPSNDAKAYYWLEKYYLNHAKQVCVTTLNMMLKRKAAVYN